MARGRPNLVIPLALLAGTLGVWGLARENTVSVRGPTDSLHFYTAIEVVDGSLYVGRKATIWGVGDGPRGSVPIYFSQERWTVRTWRHGNAYWYDKSWKSERGGYEWRIVAPLWFPAIPAGAWVLWSMRNLKRRRAEREKRCEGCRYDLSGLVAAVCPECGLEVAGG